MLPMHSKQIPEVHACYYASNLVFFYWGTKPKALQEPDQILVNMSSSEKQWPGFQRAWLPHQH
jgi:hypothetical protein